MIISPNGKSVTLHIGRRSVTLLRGGGKVLKTIVTFYAIHVKGKIVNII